MGWKDAMSEQPSHVEKMVHDAHEAIKGIDHMLRGNGGPGLAEQVRNNAERLDRLEKPAEVVKDDGIKWAVYGRWAEVLGLLTALVLSLATAMGWI